MIYNKAFTFFDPFLGCISSTQCPTRVFNLNTSSIILARRRLYYSGAEQMWQGEMYSEHEFWIVALRDSSVMLMT